MHAFLGAMAQIERHLALRIGFFREERGGVVLLGLEIPNLVPKVPPREF
jgi:hypothetical protein